MSLAPYYTERDGKIIFSREQASDFAKSVAGDFNPIHDVNATRFCVPGDLLFTVALSKIGLSSKMHITFTDTVGDGIALTFPSGADEVLDIHDDNGKQYLTLERSGAHNNNITVAEALCRKYVAFSGQTFPHIMVPLWKKAGIMLNLQRPLAMYQSMSLELDKLDIAAPSLRESGSSTLDVNGKRGQLQLRFEILDGETVVGHGQKNMILSGLKPYDEEAVQDVVAYYDNLRDNYQPQL